MIIDREEFIVGVLRQQPGLNGYELSEKLRAQSRKKAFDVFAELGRLYPILLRLERERRIWSKWSAGPSPRKRQYFAT
jgi:DNA-binding PadR family transcriptional regulator